MTDWNARQLDAIGAADELRITAPRSDGSSSGAVPIWVVRNGSDLYIRSFRGPSATWYRRVAAAGTAHIVAGGVAADVVVAAPEPGLTTAIDAEYRRKYGRYGESYVGPMTAPDAHETTLVLRPR